MSCFAVVDVGGAYRDGQDGVLEGECGGGALPFSNDSIKVWELVQCRVITDIRTRELFPQSVLIHRLSCKF